ncbi:MAG TPA: glycosyltransferase family 2 protein [Blastocatellia bacterium]|nr:glycosyltransferase family 2 protein [Blastocatellia bacterium]
MRQSIAIVTTLKQPGNILGSFINYHSKIGFDHIFLFFDDPNDSSIREALQYPNVTVVRNDDQLKHNWRQTPSYKQYESLGLGIESEVMARQALNAEVGVQLAVEKGIDWLIHLDIDELFYSPSESVQNHFQSLADKGLQRVIYTNFEAVCECVDVTDYFKEVTLFKKNRTAINNGVVSEEQRRAIKMTPQFSSQFFIGYGSGKSAVRVCKGIITNEVHGFLLPEEQGAIAALKMKLLGSPVAYVLQSVSPRYAGRVARFLAPARIGFYTTPIILHYPSCGFEYFWSKYVNLGKFPDHWLGKDDIAKIIGRFHLDARDVVNRGDREAARRFYERRVVMGDNETTNRLIEMGLLCRIVEPSHILAEV